MKRRKTLIALATLVLLGLWYESQPEPIQDTVRAHPFSMAKCILLNPGNSHRTEDCAIGVEMREMYSRLETMFGG